MTLARPPLSVAERRREREMQHELRKFHRELPGPVATTLTKKRVRMPRVELESNPFCLDRQLADNYQQLNLNKNPRFYSATAHDGARVEQNPRNHSSFINQSADLMASSRVSPRVRPEFSCLPPGTTYTPAVAHFTSPKVVSVDSSDFRQPPTSTSKANSITKAKPPLHLVPPAHDQYSVHLTSQTVSFGHRPNSASRMFDRLSKSVTGSPARKPPRSVFSTPAKTGMSVLELAQLLTPDKHSISSDASVLKSPASSFNRHDFEDEELNSARKPQQERKARERQLELEKGFSNSVYYPPRERKAGQFPAPSDQTTAQLIDKYRKLAVGKLPAVP